MRRASLVRSQFASRRSERTFRSIIEIHWKYSTEISWPYQRVQRYLTTYNLFLNPFFKIQHQLGVQQESPLADRY